MSLMRPRSRDNDEGTSLENTGIRVSSSMTVASHISAGAPLVYVGTAGWAIPAATRSEFTLKGTLLERYATRFSAAEINSSFYRPHKPATYARWAASVPATFRFSVKVPKAITHEARLVQTRELLAKFVLEVGELREKLGCLLMQLPPSFEFDESILENFLQLLRAQYAGGVAIEPRHISWHQKGCTDLLSQYAVTRVVADPVSPPSTIVSPQQSQQLYLRLHGSPRVYYSSYDDERLRQYAGVIAAHQAQHDRTPTEAHAEIIDTLAWCIFDNTASGAAIEDALTLTRLLSAPTPLPQ